MKQIVLLLISIAIPSIVLFKEKIRGISNLRQSDLTSAIDHKANNNKHLTASKGETESALGVAAFPFFSPKAYNAPVSKKSKETPRRANPYPSPKRIDFSHIEAKGIGYKVGYTKLAVLFAPEYKIGSFLPLAQLSGQAFNNGTFAGSAGFIGRYLPSSLCEVFGFYTFYDFRHGEIGNWHQISGGLEVLNRRWEVHANVRAPVGAHVHGRKRVFKYDGPYRAIRKHYEFSDYAVDANAGYYLVNSKNFQLYAAAGPYYLFGEFDNSAWGGKAMLRPQYRDYLSVEFSVSHDHIFETIYQANVIFSIPLYNYSSAIKKKSGPCRVANRQIYQPIDPDIILQEKCCWKFNWTPQDTCGSD